ncbi:hypothetical protein N5F07_20965 [Pseudomonas chengduensis]|nr:hypothetical protein [Pseudomonas chengduensis]MDH1623629.1 hypothetical protein [Pseudomonas chengduensis]
MDTKNNITSPAKTIGTASVGDTLCIGSATVLTYPRKIIEGAIAQSEKGEYGVAVILAAMASQLAASVAFTVAYKEKDIQYLEAPIG